MNIKICDAHNDFLTEIDSKNYNFYLNKCKKYGVKKLSASFWDTNLSYRDIKSKLEAIKPFIEENKDVLLLHIEDLHWLKDKESLNFLLSCHPFSCSLTWNDKNALASGSKSHGGLTKWGKHCLKMLLKNNIAVDLSHLNRCSFYQVANIVKDNLYCSHTGFCGVVKHKRNLTDKQIETIVKSNGFIGLFFFDECISKSKVASIADIVNNIKYFTSRYGYDNIGFGADFYGISHYPEKLEDYKDFKSLYNALLCNGFSIHQIEKLFYKNYLDFLKRLKNSYRTNN